MSSPLPALPKYPKMPEAQEVSMGREMRTTPATARATPLVSDSAVVGHLFSSDSGFSSDLHFSSNSLPERHSFNAPFISQSSNSRTSMLLPDSSHSGLFQPETLRSSATENTEWCTDPLQGFLDFPDNVSVHNSQIQSSGVSSEDQMRQNDWQEWFIADDDNLAPNWTDLVDVSAVDPEPKVGVIHLGATNFGCILCEDMGQTTMLVLQHTCVNTGTPMQVFWWTPLWLRVLWIFTDS